MYAYQPLQAYRTIFFNAMQLEMYIGINENEQGQTQPVLVDVVLFLDAENTVQSDDISEVLDYDLVRKDIQALAEQGHIGLQETLIERIMACCLRHEQVLGARVRTAKPDAYEHCASVGLEIQRFKSFTR